MSKRKFVPILTEADKAKFTECEKVVYNIFQKMNRRTVTSYYRKQGRKNGVFPTCLEEFEITSYLRDLSIEQLRDLATIYSDYD